MTSHLKPRRCAAILLLASLLAIPTASDARGGRAAARALGGAAAAGASGPVLSQTELQQCLATQGRLDALAPKIKESSAKIAAERQKLEQGAGAIDKKRESVDRTNQKSVDAFNAGVKRHQKQVEQFKASVASHNDQITVYERNAALFKEACAGKSYRESDMQAVLAQTQAGAR